ncbi:MAG TPA: ATP synthase subunit I [Candidatus Manganitrophaceae bacterium]|nr:ATP synthase subunit I [Candidatus Manganitrophaceae bacterium]
MRPSKQFDMRADLKNARSPHPIPPSPPVDRERFLARTNAALRRIERNGLVILGLVGLVTVVFFGSFGASLLIGGLFGMFNFRSLHRMFQRRVLDPEVQKREQFFYSLKVFVMIGLFFWIIQWESASVFGIIVGFFMITTSVLLETQRK